MSTSCLLAPGLMAVLQVVNPNYFGRQNAWPLVMQTRLDHREQEIITGAVVKLGGEYLT